MPRTQIQQKSNLQIPMYIITYTVTNSLGKKKTIQQKLYY